MKLLNYNIVIAGAGPAGIAAALGAARAKDANGNVPKRKIALIERYGVVGGGLPSSYIRPFLGTVENENVGREIEQLIKENCKYMSPVESAKVVLTQLLHEAGVDLYLQTQVNAVEKDGEDVKSILADFRGQKLKFTADAFLDCTGDGDLSVLSGAEFEMGREGDRLVQPVSIMFTIDGIENDYGLLCEHEEHYTVLPNGKEYLDLCHTACASGELPPSVNIVRLYATAISGERMVNATQMNHVNPLDPLSLSNAEYELRMQVQQIVAFLQNNVPGFEHIRVNGSCTTTGVRESRRICGDYTMTAEDLFAGRRFDDAVVEDAMFVIDIHNPDGAGQAETDGCPHKPEPYEIPYRALLPKGLNNLIVAGRCISGDHRAHASYRVMRICLAMGHAAGAAAAQMTDEKIASRAVDIRRVQKEVRIVK